MKKTVRSFSDIFIRFHVENKQQENIFDLDATRCALDIGKKDINKVALLAFVLKLIKFLAKKIVFFLSE